MSGLRIPATAALMLLSTVTLRGHAQSNPNLLASTATGAVVRSIRIVPGREGAAVEILGNQPIVPSISKIEDPSRLVIDLPNVLLTDSKKHIDFRNNEIKGVRISQFQTSPAVARIVLDLAQPVNFTWDAAGNRLMVRTRPAQEKAEPVASVPTFTQGVQPIAAPMGSGANGALLLAGSRIAPGSSVTAGSDTAVLRLGRGGEVRVCPGSTVSITPSQNGRALMLGMSIGAMEAHYYLDASSDSVLTPDFRIQLPGPGEFHLAISADSRGNTCVRALPGNTASVIVSELLGDGTYQIKPSEQVVFRAGRLTNADAAIPTGCGCPPPTIPVIRSAAPVTESPMPASLNLAASAGKSKPSPEASSPSPAQLPMGSEIAPLPASKPNEVHVQVEAPFVFRADDPPPAPVVSPAAIQQARLLPVNSRRTASEMAAVPEAAPPPHQRFFGRIRSFFAALFG